MVIENPGISYGNRRTQLALLGLDVGQWRDQVLRIPGMFTTPKSPGVC